MISEGDTIRLTTALVAEDDYNDAIVHLPVGQTGLVVDTLGGRACEVEFVVGDVDGDDYTVVMRTVEFDQCELVVDVPR